MDLVLETLDRYVFDDVYAKIAPVELQKVIDDKWVDLLSLNKLSSNDTMLAETLKLTNSLPRVNKDVYGITPFLFDFTEATYKSLLPRNNLIREFFWSPCSVCCCTCSPPPCPTCSFSTRLSSTTLVT